jgi:hypothetical protein
VAEHYPWLLETYDAFPENIMRADTARILYMHRFGGARARAHMAPSHASPADFPPDVTAAFAPCRLPSRAMCFQGCMPGPVLAQHKTLLQSYPWRLIRQPPVRAGLYADLDIDVLRPFDGLLAGQRLVLASMTNDSAFAHAIPNAWMASAPGHPFWQFCLAHILASSAPCTYRKARRCAAGGPSPRKSHATAQHIGMLHGCDMGGDRGMQSATGASHCKHAAVWKAPQHEALSMHEKFLW